MSRWLRIVFTGLLVLALPLQAHAAQSMSMCGPGHQLPGVAAHGAADGHRQDADSIASAPSSQAHAHQAHASAPGTALDAEPSHASPGKCSVCAVCCSVVALTGALLVFTPSSAPSLYTVERPTLLAGNIPGGFERPPRASLS